MVGSLPDVPTDMRRVDEAARIFFGCPEIIRICLHLRHDSLTMTFMSDVTLCPMLKQQ